MHYRHFFENCHFFKIADTLFLFHKNQAFRKVPIPSRSCCENENLISYFVRSFTTVYWITPRAINRDGIISAGQIFLEVSFLHTQAVNCLNNTQD